MSENEPTRAELAERLRQAEAAVADCERMSIAHQFTAAVMHEVNNPLEAIINLAYLLELESQGSPQALEYLAILKEQLSVLADVTRATLSFHRDQTAARHVDLVMVAQAALKLHFTKLNTNNIEVRTRFTERAVSYVIASEILQVLSNLIINAIEWLQDSSQPTLHVRVHCRQHGLHITVADNGPGIFKAVADRLFKARIPGRSTGMGTGLQLSKGLVLKHSGRLRFRTCRATGKSGTVFQLWFPHADVA